MFLIVTPPKEQGSWGAYLSMPISFRGSRQETWLLVDSLVGSGQLETSHPSLSLDCVLCPPFP